MSGQAHFITLAMNKCVSDLTANPVIICCFSSYDSTVDHFNCRLQPVGNPERQRLSAPCAGLLKLVYSQYTFHNGIVSCKCGKVNHWSYLMKNI